MNESRFGLSEGQSPAKCDTGFSSLVDVPLANLRFLMSESDCGLFVESTSEQAIATIIKDAFQKSSLSVQEVWSRANKITEAQSPEELAYEEVAQVLKGQIDIRDTRVWYPVAQILGVSAASL